MNQIFDKVESSFKLAMKGEESVHNLIWWWGITAYLVAYFIVDKLIKITDIKVFDVVVSLLAVAYFGWHFYVLKKCAPKKPKLSKEEKKRLSEEEKKDRGRRFLRKLFLREPLSKWDPVFITLVVDVFCMANFLGYVIS